MDTRYSEQDTEQARQVEQSSAGIQTQQLRPSAPFSRPAGRNNLAALALIGIGVLLLLGRFVPDRDALTAGMILFTIGSCLMFFGFWKRVYGLLIPSCILFGLSVGIPFADITNGVSIVWGLALSFMAIFVVGMGVFGQRSHWPVYPAVILFAVGLIVAVASVPAIFLGGLVWLPLLLVAVGLYLGWRSRSA